MVGRTLEGRKELIGFQVDFCKGTQSWNKLLPDPKNCGLSVPQELAIGKGAPDFWKPLEQQSGVTRRQRE